MNRHIEAIILGGPYHIEQGFAMRCLASYIEDMNALEAGAQFADLGISARRHATRAGVISLNAQGLPIMLQDPSLLYDEAATPEGSFAHLRLSGVMRSEDGMSSQGISTLLRDMYAAIGNPKIQGIMLEVQSGGGEATAGQMLHAGIAGSPKPVVAFAHFMASAALMGTLAADEIVASSDMAEIGSIGTMLSFYPSIISQIKELRTDMYADKSKNKNAAFRALMEGDSSMLQEELDVYNEGFLSSVQQYRPLQGSDKDKEYTLSGAMFSANEAKERGLIDSVGGYAYALKRLTAAVERRNTITT